MKIPFVFLIKHFPFFIRKKKAQNKSNTITSHEFLLLADRIV